MKGVVCHFDTSSNFHSSRYEDNTGEISSHSTLITLLVLLSICCCCYCVGCCLGKKWRRRFCRDYFGISIGKKKGSIRRRHIRDINDIQHAPVNLDDSLSGYEPYLNLPEDSASGDASQAHSNEHAQLDGDIETMPMENDQEVDHSNSDILADDVLIATTVDEDMGTLLL